MGQGKTNLAVVDVETTGLGNMDRIVEIAVVLLDSETYETVDEFDSLVNPMRDVGPTRIHGITASMVSGAPTFEEVAAPLGGILTGSVLVAHNLPFDRRFLEGEFVRAGGTLDAGIGLCTFRSTRQKLEQACAALDIEIGQAHRALADARACAALLARLAQLGLPAGLTPAVAEAPSKQGVVRTLRRDAFGESRLPMRAARFQFSFPSTDEAELSYLLMLDRYLDDGRLTPDEQLDLAGLAEVNGIRSQVPRLHEAYLASVAAAAWRDGQLTAEERARMVQIADQLSIPLALPDEQETTPTDVGAGMRVCFTGEPVIGGRVIERDYLVAAAVSRGLIAVNSVTKKACDLLVCADVASSSGKAQKARNFGIPIIDAQEFLSQLGLS